MPDYQESLFSLLPVHVPVPADDRGVAQSSEAVPDVDASSLLIYSAEEAQGPALGPQSASGANGYPRPRD